MHTTAPILYSGFYDFPLAFTVRFQGNLYLFARDFDEDLDEYVDHYRVSLMPDLTDAEIQTSWRQIEKKATASLGEVAVNDVRFDATHRQAIDPAVLQSLALPREVALR